MYQKSVLFFMGVCFNAFAALTSDVESSDINTPSPKSYENLFYESIGVQELTAAADSQTYCRQVECTIAIFKPFHMTVNEFLFALQASGRYFWPHRDYTISQCLHVISGLTNLHPINTKRRLKHRDVSVARIMLHDALGILPEPVLGCDLIEQNSFRHLRRLLPHQSFIDHVRYFTAYVGVKGCFDDSFTCSIEEVIALIDHCHRGSSESNKKYYQRFANMIEIVQINKKLKTLSGEDDDTDDEAMPSQKFGPRKPRKHR